LANIVKDGLEYVASRNQRNLRQFVAFTAATVVGTLFERCSAVTILCAQEAIGQSTRERWKIHWLSFLAVHRRTPQAQTPLPRDSSRANRRPVPAGGVSGVFQTPSQRNVAV
jgi:hypothetical protein